MEARPPARVHEPGDPRRVRCPECGTLQLRILEPRGSVVEIKCRKCGRVMTKTV